jgi:hypothetical protein
LIVKKTAGKTIRASTDHELALDFPIGLQSFLDASTPVGGQALAHPSVLQGDDLGR